MRFGWTAGVFVAIVMVALIAGCGSESNPDSSNGSSVTQVQGGAVNSVTKKEPPKPNNQFFEGRISEEGHYRWTSEQVHERFGKFGDPKVRSDVVDHWTYRTKSGEKIWFWFSGGHGDPLTISQMKWWPVDQQDVREILPESVLRADPIRIVCREHSPYFHMQFFPRESRGSRRGYSGVHRQLVCRSTATGWEKGAFNPSTGKDDWTIKPWSELQENAELIVYQESKYAPRDYTLLDNYGHGEPVIIRSYK